MAALAPAAPRHSLASLLPRDARVYQILFLGSLLTTGVLIRDFSIRGEQVLLTFAAGLATQALWKHALGLRHVNYLSAIITCFGLSILLRADSLWVHPFAAMVALSAKFVVRINGKHLFNPANLGVMLGILILPGAWASPGQWGNELLVACWVLALGFIVTRRANRFDISVMFLAFFLGLVALRVLYLGQPWQIWWHQWQSGALLLFTFFMVSDPMTIPNRRGARVLYAGIVAVGAFLWQYALFRPNALVWALFLATPVVPLLDRIWPGSKHEWVPCAVTGSAPDGKNPPQAADPT